MKILLVIGAVFLLLAGCAQPQAVENRTNVTEPPPPPPPKNETPQPNVTNITPPPPPPTCQEFCITQPHEDCPGEWNVSGTYPGCSCVWNCYPQQNATNETKAEQKSWLKFYSNLGPLPQGHYEGWAVFGSEKLSIGKFEAGKELKLTSDRDLAKADRIIITIEGEGDSDSVPGVPVLAGDIQNGSADLRFPADLFGSKGNYILTTPSDGIGSEDNERSGVWFVLDTDPPSIGLVLPDPPDGWVYEGWVVNKGVTFSTGKFTSTYGPDSFNGYSGPQPGYNYPGEDFLHNKPPGVYFPLKLADGTSRVMISLEPDVDGFDPTGDGPLIVPLKGTIPEGVHSSTDLPLSLDLGLIPSGDVLITPAGPVPCPSYCETQPHPSCVGTWNVTGDFAPECGCKYVCSVAWTD
jgi:hypothetical protein